MTRIYHYDTTYEQEAEDGTVIASVELRIYYTVTDSGKPTWDDPGWPAQAEFYVVNIEAQPLGKPRKYRALDPHEPGEEPLEWWARDFVEDHQSELLISAGEDDEAAREYAAEMRDAARQERIDEDRMWGEG